MRKLLVIGLEVAVCFAVAFILSCASVQPQTTPKGPLYSYRAELSIGLGGSEFTGLAVTKLAPVNIVIKSLVSMDRIQVTSCARQNICENGGFCDSQFVIDRDWWTGSGKSAVYYYEPNEAESKGVCPLYIEVYSKADLTDWGMVAFRTDETLPAKLACNGSGWTFSGLSVCQTKNGLDQSIKFDRALKAFESEPACHMTQDATDATKFWLRPEMGFCKAVFSDGANEHRLLLLGYDSVLLRVK